MLIMAMAMAISADNIIRFWPGDVIPPKSSPIYQDSARILTKITSTSL